MDDTDIIKLFQDRSQDAVSAASAILMTALSMKAKFPLIKIIMYIDAKRAHFKSVYVFCAIPLDKYPKGVYNIAVLRNTPGGYVV